VLLVTEKKDNGMDAVSEIGKDGNLSAQNLKMNHYF
jgi:hypothetical protein